MASDEALPGHGTSRQHKHILHLNFREKVACRKEHRSLESQKKAFDKQINKEEFEMRQLLQRLHVVRASALHTDCMEPGNWIPNETYAVDDAIQEPQTCTNPYPISFKTLSRKERRKTVSGSEVPKWRRSLSGDRKESVEYEDMQGCRPARRSLPMTGSARLPLSRTISLGCRSFTGNPVSPRVPQINVWKPGAQFTGAKQKVIPAEPSERSTVTPRQSMEFSTSPFAISETPNEGRKIIRHLSLKERRTLARSRDVAYDSVLTPDILEKISRPRSLPNIRTETSPSPSSASEIFTFPNIKRSVLAFPMSRNEKEMKCCLKRRQSSRRSRIGSGSGSKVAVTDQTTALLSTTGLTD